MGSAIFPAPSAGGGIKLVQRGTAASAGNITITGVDTTKTFVRSISQGSTGTVATNSTVSSSTSTTSEHSIGKGTNIWNNTGYTSLSQAFGSGSSSNGTPSGYNGQQSYGIIPSHSVSNPSSSISGGTTDVTAKQMGVYLSDSTTLVATGACRWEVVEFA